MSDSAPKFDIALAHRYFAVNCFNETWTLIEKPTRTAAENEEMILRSSASLWHWMQRTDHTDRNLAVGHWQLARAFALAGQGENALRHGRRSLEQAEKCAPFFIGYAHESIARAAVVLQDDSLFVEHLKEAWAHAAKVTEADDRALLEKDLRELEGQSTAG